MDELYNLEDVKGGKKEYKLFRSTTGALKIINNKFAAVIIGNTKILNIWEDDYGIYHCQVKKDTQIIQNNMFTKKAEVKAWLNYWIEKIN